MTSIRNPRSPKPTLELHSRVSKLLVSISSTSWHVLDEPDLFPEGAALRQVFGVTWAAGLFREPTHGILKHMRADEFYAACQIAWRALLRDQELISYSYQYELESQKGVRHGGAQSGGFTVRGLRPYITTRPKGYCTLRLTKILADGSPSPDVELIDLRKVRRIETDTNGYLKIHRRSQTVDWYREMPDILAFAANANADFVEIRLYGR
jgi:hypothetical protein